MTTSCIDEYVPDIGTYENALVVDGSFSNSENPSIVTLTRTVRFNEYELPYETNAEVQIRVMGGASHYLNEVSDGIYHTDPNEFRGVPGRSYQLKIQTASGALYESDWQELLPPSHISDIRKEFEDQFGLDVDDPIDRGIQIYLDGEQTENEYPYFRWSFLETYEYRVPFPTRVDYTSDKEILPHDRKVELCWKYLPSEKILLTSTENQKENIITDQPIQFISINDERLFYKYAILIRQHTIHKETYEYYRNIQQTTETSGSLFDPIPTENFGNLRSLNDSEPVIGYFEVAGIDERRIWVDRDELPFNPVIPTGFENCPEIVINTTNPRFYNARIEFYLRQGMVLVDSLFPFITWAGFTMSTPRCADCTVTGTNIKPAFWP